MFTYLLIISFHDEWNDTGFSQLEEGQSVTFQTRQSTGVLEKKTRIIRDPDG